MIIKLNSKCFCVTTYIWCYLERSSSCTVACSDVTCALSPCLLNRPFIFFADEVIALLRFDFVLASL